MTDRAPTALGHLRVVEVSRTIAGAYSGKLLADLGADVIKVEPPGGDPLRRRGTVPPGTEARGSGLYQHLNTNKRSVCLDLGTDEGVHTLERLAGTAQVLVEDLAWAGVEVPDPWVSMPQSRPGVHARVLPCDPRGPQATAPISGLTLQAGAGWVSRRGQVEVDPVQVGGEAHEYVGGVYAACAILTGWRRATQAEERVDVEVPMLECVFNTVAYPQLRRETLLELGYARTRYTAYIPGVLRCRDGWVAVNCLTGQHWMDLCALFGVPQYAEGYAEMRYEGSQLEEFYRVIQPWFDERGREEIVELCQLFRVPASPIGDGASMPAFEQFRARGFHRDDPTGTFTVPGPPYRLSATPVAVKRAAPSAGADTDDVLTGL